MSKELDIPIIFISVTDPVVAEAIVTNSSEVQSATRTLAAVTDAIYVPIDSTILSAMIQIKKSPQNDEL